MESPFAGFQTHVAPPSPCTGTASLSTCCSCVRPPQPVVITAHIVLAGQSQLESAIFFCFPVFTPKPHPSKRTTQRGATPLLDPTLRLCQPYQVSPSSLNNTEMDSFLESIELGIRAGSILNLCSSAKLVPRQRLQLHHRLAQGHPPKDSKHQLASGTCGSCSTRTF